MSKFDAKEVSSWIQERDDSGRKVAFGKDGERDVRVWVSDLKEADGYYPIRGKYLMPLPYIVMEDGVIKDMKPIWVTRKQYNDILKTLKLPVKSAAKFQVIQMLGKAAKYLFEQIKAVIPIDAAFEGIIDEVFQKALDILLKTNYLEDKLGIE